MANLVKHEAGRMTLELAEVAHHRQLAQLIDALDRPNFWLLFVRSVEKFVPFDNWVVLRFSDQARPQVFTENPLPDGSADLLFQDYLNGLYLFDPFYLATRETPRSGLFLLDDVAPENFKGTDYYQLYFQRNIVADEAHFNYALENGDTLCFSIGSKHRYTHAETALLTIICPWVIALMRQRLAFEAGADTAPATAREPNWHDGVGARIEQLRDTKLTAREVEISQLLLGGFAVKRIAEKLDISVETVRAHKKHIYGKLQINSQSELFAVFYQAQATPKAA
jgi:DNA-binding CsgD family transcriptional regulator